MNEAKLEKRPEWWLMLLQGVASIILGILFLKSPASSVLALTVFLGVYWIGRGLIGFVEVGIGPRFTLGWRLVSAIVSIAAGVFVLAQPVSSAAVLPVVCVIALAVNALISGGVSIYYGATGAGAGTVVLGVFDVLAGVLLLAAPFAAALAVPYVLGALCVIGGITVVTVCVWLRSEVRDAAREAVAA